MKRIGLISDTHGHWDKKIAGFLKNCDEVWHAGDIGNLEIAEQLEDFKPLRAVYGNIDDARIRSKYPKMLRFNCEDVDILITHIGGYPGRYEKEILAEIKQNPPKLFISGHSHILKVIYDKKHDLLHMNPGAAGLSGFHTLKTALRFTINNNNIANLEILEIPRR
ncbi:MAG: metallophosphoesterase family protein [Bacteroidales bacterium]